jgi:multidrug efflux system membrane fusion protein
LIIVSLRNSLLTAIIAGGALLLAGCNKQQAKTAAAGPPVVPVSIATAAQESVPTELRVVGTVDASSIVQVKSQVAGQLERVAFTEGQNVKQGDLLFVIDRRPFEDALRQAEATLARDAAQAKIAETDAAR